MSTIRSVVRPLRRNRLTNIPLRAMTAFGVFAPRTGQILSWLATSREDTNFTYELTEGNRLELANMLAIVCKQPVATMAGYIAEAREDEQLRGHVLGAVARSPSPLPTPQTRRRSSVRLPTMSRLTIATTRAPPPRCSGCSAK